MDAIKALEGEWLMLVGGEPFDPARNTTFNWRNGHLFRAAGDGGPLVLGNGKILASLGDNVFLELQVPDEPANATRLSGYHITEIEEAAGGDLREIVVLIREQPTQH